MRDLRVLDGEWCVAAQELRLADAPVTRELDKVEGRPDAITNDRERVVEGESRRGV